MIFVTAYDRHALEAFNVNALDYLLKPFTQERLAQALERVRDRVAHLVPVEDIERSWQASASEKPSRAMSREFQPIATDASI